MIKKFKTGDFVLEGNKIGIIVKEYHTQVFDWEVAYLTGSPTHCYLDCCKDR